MKETNATRKKDEGNMYIFHMLISLQSIHYDFDFLRTISYIFFSVDVDRCGWISVLAE